MCGSSDQLVENFSTRRLTGYLLLFQELDELLCDVRAVLARSSCDARRAAWAGYLEPVDDHRAQGIFGGLPGPVHLVQEGRDLFVSPVFSTDLDLSRKGRRWIVDQDPNIHKRRNRPRANRV